MATWYDEAREAQARAYERDQGAVFTALWFIVCAGGSFLGERVVSGSGEWFA